MKWLLLGDRGFLLVGWVISAALAAWHLRRPDRTALRTWSLVQGMYLGLLAVLDWADGVAPTLAVVPLPRVGPSVAQCCMWHFMQRSLKASRSPFFWNRSWCGSWQVRQTIRFPSP